MALYGIYGKHTTAACPWNNIDKAFFAHRLRKIYSKGHEVGGNSGATWAEQGMNDRICLKYHVLTLLGHKYLTPRALDSERAHAEADGFP